jgi:hypothetical protein
MKNLQFLRSLTHKEVQKELYKLKPSQTNATTTIKKTKDTKQGARPHTQSSNIEHGASLKKKSVHSHWKNQLFQNH